MYTFGDVWAKCIESIKQVASPTAMSIFIDKLVPIKLENNTAYFFINDQSQKRDIIVARYGELILKTLNEVVGNSPELEIYCNADLPAEYSASRLSEKDTEEANEDLIPFDIENAYTFENFIVGGSNEFAHAASFAVAKSPAKKYNPLFIYGGSGLGKTHLLFAIKHEISKNNPDYNIVFVKCEDFVNELIEALREGNQLPFRNKYRKADVLLIDDIQFIGGKNSSQLELFHTFNVLYEEKKQIVLVSDRPPREIPLLEERLRTRFEGGLMADIQAPDAELRLAIIKEKAESLKIKLPPDVAEYIASRLKSNIRQLEGTVKKIHAYYMLTGVAPNIAIAQNSIKDVLNENEPLAVTIDKILTEVSRYTSVSIEDIKGQKRTADVTAARQMAMYIMREITPMSLPEIGKEFGGRDHATVHHAVTKVGTNIESNYAAKASINEMIKNIKER